MMLVRLGTRRGAADAVELLAECHERIRRHLAIARRLAAAQGHAASDIRETAAQVRRYFAEALPLHIRDEEETILALLAGRDADVDDALASMAADHVHHAPLVDRLVALCDEIAGDAGQLERVAAELAPLVARLEPQLLEHLELEERTIFPALRAAPQADRDLLAAAMRARRAGT